MPNITPEMIEAGLQHYSEGGCSGLADYERMEVVRAILEAALSVEAVPREIQSADGQVWVRKPDAPPAPAASEPVEWQRHTKDFGWQKVGPEDIEHYREKGAQLRPLYTHPAPAPAVECLTRPIIGIENRTAQEVFDIMADRIRLAAAPTPQTEGGR